MAEPASEGLLVRIGPGPAAGAAPDSASAGAGRARRRTAIVLAATELFLRQGYQATSTEQIASAAAVSKQTVYNQFGDKEALFREIILGVTATAEAFAEELPQAFARIRTATDVAPTLEELARRWLAAVTDPQVLALRRLVVSEATRFPDLAATYYRRAPARVLDVLAAQLQWLHEHGLLAVDRPDRAADDLAFLLLGRTLDHGMFHTADDATGVAVEDLAHHGVTVFLAAYRAD